ncbi:uncharacterized protein LOC6651366 [Drosophila willistoni]|uniref:uncharacterized protein LOC6651366 n=1 Tax=Drosophila willistoni TaxID=7260 RepID=UPI000C26D2D5|nr:uncharacterized protein LOC6651366 [Drosophila willistoni]
MNIDIEINSAASFTNEASASASLSSASNRLSCVGLPIPAPKLSAASRSRRNLFNSHLPPFVDCQWTSRHRRRSPYPNLVIEQCQLTFSTNLLLKLTQLWLVIVLLVPFLFCLTSISLIRPVSGHDFLGPMSNSSNSINGVRLQLQLRQPVEQQYQQRVQDMSTQIGVTVNKTETKCSQLKINNILLNQSYETSNNTVKCEEFESLSYNRRSNNNSLINLSHSEAQSGSVGLDGTTAHDARNRRQVRKRRTETLARQKHGRAKRFDKEKLTRLVMHGLGLKRLPDMKKANISQLEYSSKYIEYLNRLRQHHNRWEDRSDDYDMNKELNSELTNLHLLSIVTNSFSDISRKRWRPRRSTKRTSARSQGYEERQVEASKDRTSILLHFPLNLNDAHIQYDKIDEANVRLMLLYSSSLANTDPRPVPSRKKSKHKLNGGGSHCHQDESMPEQAESKSNSGIAKHKGDLHRNRLHRHPRILNLKVYQLLSPNKRQILDKRRIEFENIDYEDTHSQWLEFDVTKAVRGWLNRSQENLGIEIQCDKCKRIGARILSDVSTSTTTTTTTDDAKEGDYERERFHLMPVLNIIGHLGHTQAHREGPPAGVGVAAGAGVGNQYYPHRVEQDFNRRIWPNSCYKVHQRCCRHQLDVVFKDIKGFEFILQPKSFDAGYCQGRCPPRHNPANHHALLQSLIWQQDHNRVPRPCCAASKLTELEILHVDEEHSDKLKISTWSDMQVVECACS